MMRKTVLFALSIALVLALATSAFALTQQKTEKKYSYWEKRYDYLVNQNQRPNQFTGNVILGSGASSLYPRMYIYSIPPKAEVYIDGVQRGVTPAIVSVEEGWHTVDIKKPDYQPFSGKYKVYRKDTVRITAKLSRIRTKFATAS